ncbi:hypothetical protein K438DRAFT_1772815 [Mycena galopus ATCC 62051]|nr:hypothetical protein K438DRAFT_1772815 [Mycena galopus ATCC 62051]
MLQRVLDDGDDLDREGDENLPPLADPSDSGSSDDDGSANSELRPASSPSPATAPSQRNARCAGKPKISLYWKVESKEEKTARLEWENCEYREHRAENQLREMEAERRKAARKRADGNERQQLLRNRQQQQNIADGWICGQRRCKWIEKRTTLLGIELTSGREYLAMTTTPPSKP